MKFIGDLLLLFNCDGQPEAKRSQTHPWSEIQKNVLWRLAVQEPDDNWKGFPFYHVRNQEWEIFLLGELFGLTKRVDCLEELLKGITDCTRQPDELNGHCLLLAWNITMHRWHVWTNRFATLHMYYASDGKRAALGTFFPAVSGFVSRRQLDWQGLAGFFNFGFFPGDLTHFQDVKILRPASETILDENGALIQQKRYWAWRHNPDTHRSYDDTVNEFADTFNSIVEDQAGSSHLALPISGGLDSRTIASAFKKDSCSSGKPESLWAYSYGYTPSSVETSIARQVAEKRGIHFESFIIQPYLFNRMDQVMSSLEGFNDITMCRQAAIADEIALNADTILCGHLGDLVLNDTGLSQCKSGSMNGADLTKLHFIKSKKMAEPGLTRTS